MVFNKKFLLIFLLLIISLAVFTFFHFNIPRKIEMRKLGLGTSTQETEKPTQIKVNTKTKVKYPQDYTIVMVGDSMTERLGNSDELMAYLKKYYPNKTFQILNYGFGSTNILTVEERLKKETYYGRVFMPILDIAFDVILIESFGHNPLSQLPLEIGLKQQTEALDRIVASIKSESPTAKTIFVATIAPNTRRYGEGKVDLEPQKRVEWAGERVSYIKNHIEYAQSHQIPIINIYEKSLNKDGDGNLDYISTADFIHPSPNGIYFISEEIAKFIFENQILNP